MYYLVNVDHNSVAAHHQKWLWGVLRSLVYPME